MVELGWGLAGSYRCGHPRPRGDRQRRRPQRIRLGCHDQPVDPAVATVRRAERGRRRRAARIHHDEGTSLGERRPEAMISALACPARAARARRGLRTRRLATDAGRSGGKHASRRRGTGWATTGSSRCERTAAGRADRKRQTSSGVWRRPGSGRAVARRFPHRTGPGARTSRPGELPPPARQRPRSRPQRRRRGDQHPTRRHQVRQVRGEDVHAAPGISRRWQPR